jgi:hypothetical protein
MPRTIHVTVTYSVHVDDDKITNKDALIFAQNTLQRNEIDSIAHVHDRWVDKKPKPGIGSY